MKTFCLVLSLICTTNAFAGTEVPLAMKDVAKQVRDKNLLVMQEAEKVYQAKEAVKVVRANLLPKLNLWRILGGAVGAGTGGVTSIIGSVIEDLVPFLVPNNWFRLKEQNLFSAAEKEGYRALRANQVFSAKLLYMEVYNDERLYGYVAEILKNVQDVKEYVVLQERFGQVPQGTSKPIEIKALALQDDLNSLTQLLVSEKQYLSQMLGFKPGETIALIPIQVFAPQLIDRDKLVNAAVKQSPELQQFDFLISASVYVRREAYFSVLGTSSMSRGTTGGIFDAYPVQDGLGFGLGPSVRISRSQGEMLKLQKQAAEETLVRQIDVMVDSQAVDIDRYNNSSQRLKLATEVLDQLKARIKLGGSVSYLEITDALHDLMAANTDFVGVGLRAMQTMEKVDRLMFASDYDSDAYPQDEVPLQ